MGREIEGDSALSVWLARWPGVQASLFNLQFERTREGGVIQGWPESLAGEWPPDTFLLLLGEAFSFPADLLLDRLNEDRPGVPVIGGMASGGTQPGENRLLLGRAALAEGAAAALISGPVRLRTVVSQGCRPIGQRFVITKAHDNVIETLGGKPALGALHDVVNALPVEDRRLLRNGLFVGRAISEYRETFGRGDFLVRNIMGVDDKAGTIAMGDYVRVGQTVQFHVRDADTADEDLRAMLENVRATEGDAPAGALLFNCNGRGTRLFVDQPCHDVNVARQFLPGTAIAGFFAGGEIGPVGGKNFVHGHTASFALFRPAE
jgi:small ligand-binding sensory domain FIST